MAKITARDRRFAINGFAVKLENSKDVDMDLACIYSNAVTTNSPLLIHDVIRNVKDGLAWRRFCNDVKRRIAEIKQLCC